MANPEQPKSEGLESEKNPEVITEKAAEEVVASAELKEAVDPAASAEAVKKSTEFLKEGKGRFAIDLARVGGLFIAKMILGVLKLVKAIATGEASYKKGKELGKEATSFEIKKPG